MAKKKSPSSNTSLKGKQIGSHSTRWIVSILLAVIVVSFLMYSGVFVACVKSRVSSRNSNDADRILSPVLEHTKEILSYGVRVPTSAGGTSGLLKTREYIIKQFDSSKWDIEIDAKKHTTVMGEIEFQNIIVTYKRAEDSNNSARKRIIVSAHYDSKLMNFKKPFLGATDSVVPCAMMIDFAKHWENVPNAADAKFDLQFVFFDGEEAFVNWEDTDSLYGSRQLAERWKKENKLASIEFLMLLDLIGAKDPTFYNFGHHFQMGTASSFVQLSNIEDQLRQKNQLNTGHKYFATGRYGDMVQDDHVPFLHKGVPIIHLIAVPFPDVWHTENDDFSALDEPTIQDLQLILVNFLLNKLLPRK